MIKLTLFILFFTVQIFPADSAEELLDSVQNKFDSITDLSADFSRITNGKTDLSGKFLFKKENKIRLELKNLLLISDGKTSWNYNKKENKVIASNYDESDPSVLSIKNIIYKYPDECSISKEEDGNAEILVLIPGKNSGLNFNSVKLRINNNYLIEEALIEDKNNNIIELQFSNYKTNQNIAESKFSFTPPEGAEFIDLR